MIYVRALSDVERGELKRQARRQVGRISERIRMVLLSDRRYSVAHIAAIFECSEATVREWLARFEADGVTGLHDRPRAGRPRQADAVARERIRQTVDQAPASAGYALGYWTLVTLCSHLAERLDLRLSQATLRRILHAVAYRWRRPRHCLPADPETAAKMWGLAQRIGQAPQSAVILCEDACDLHLLPVLRAMWMRRGQQRRIPTPGSNRKRSICGALDWQRGDWTYLVTQHQRAVEFIAFLEQLLLAYPSQPILLIVDNASIHTAKVVRAWLLGHPRLELLYLPTSSGHAQNPVEKVWWRLKDQVAANRLHGSIDELISASHGFFASFPPEAARKLAA